MQPHVACRPFSFDLLMCYVFHANIKECKKQKQVENM
jgi:hypothetical protein